MPSIEIRIPQLGEGLQEARLLRFLKQPGEPIARDEPIFEMETDKAVMEIEAPAAGTLEAWSAREDDVLPIGAIIGTIAANGGAHASAAAAPDAAVASRIPEAPAGDTPAASPTESEAAPPRNAVVAPRVRAYAREHGLSDADLARLAQQAGGKVTPDQIDAFVAGRGNGAGPLSSLVEGPVATPPERSRREQTAYEDVALPQRQRTLVFRLQRGTQAVIPATVQTPIPWGVIEDVRRRWRPQSARGAMRRPARFLLFAWCVVQATRSHPRFRSALIGDSTLRQYDQLHLGIAVARPDDELLMARVPNASALTFAEFIERADEAIAHARDGQDQAGEAMQLSLTNMANTGIRSAIPVVTAPAVATLFLGAPYEEAYRQPDGAIGFRRVADTVMTFDHRLLNGIGASRFLADVRKRIERLEDELSEYLGSLESRV